MKLFWALALTAFLPISAQGQRRTQQTPAPSRWQDNKFCPDATQCDRAWLWTESDAGSILATLKGETLSISIRSKRLEEEICLSPAEVRFIFRQKIERTCTECMALKDGSRAMLSSWVDTSATPAKPLRSLHWVAAALTKLQKENDQLAPLVQKALGGTNAP